MAVVRAIFIAAFVPFSQSLWSAGDVSLVTIEKAAQVHCQHVRVLYQNLNCMKETCEAKYFLQKYFESLPTQNKSFSRAFASKIDSMEPAELGKFFREVFENIQSQLHEDERASLSFFYWLQLENLAKSIKESQSSEAQKLFRAERIEWGFLAFQFEWVEKLLWKTDFSLMESLGDIRLGIFEVWRLGFLLNRHDQAYALAYRILTSPGLDSSETTVSPELWHQRERAWQLMHALSKKAGRPQTTLAVEKFADTGVQATPSDHFVQESIRILTYSHLKKTEEINKYLSLFHLEDMYTKGQWVRFKKEDSSGNQ